MGKRDVTSSMVWAVLGGAFCAGGLSHGIMVEGQPGAGFFPLLGGLVLIGLSLAVFLSSLRQEEEKRPFFESRKGATNVATVLAALFLYLVVVKYAGFLVTTFLFMIAMLRLKPRSWLFILAAALLCTLFFYVLFQVLLSVPLPRGILGV